MTTAKPVDGASMFALVLNLDDQEAGNQNLLASFEQMIGWETGHSTDRLNSSLYSVQKVLQAHGLGEIPGGSSGR